MENKSIIKKVVLIAILVVIVIAIVIVGINAASGKKEKSVSNSNENSINKSSQTGNIEENDESKKKVATISELEDGVMYSVTNEEIEPNIVLKDNYFDTQIAEIMLNFNEYEGKTIQIEGLYFENSPYTFVGRYSTSNLCPDCPSGFSYFEYEWYGDKEISLQDSESWIKVIGTLKRGNDGMEYYYIDVANLEIMNEAGNTTVSN